MATVREVIDEAHWNNDVSDVPFDLGISPDTDLGTHDLAAVPKGLAAALPALLRVAWTATETDEDDEPSWRAYCDAVAAVPSEAWDILAEHFGGGA